MLNIRFLMLLILTAAPIFAKDKFLVITPEKTGTFLLLKAVKLLSGMDYEFNEYSDMPEAVFNKHIYECEKHGTFGVFHISADDKYIKSLKARKYKVIFMMRDPRDQLMSMYFYIRDRGWTYDALNMYSRFATMSFDEQIDEMITGAKLCVSVPHLVIGNKLPWIWSNLGIYIARFENLVGPKGGGTKEAQIAELNGIAKFLNIKTSKRQINAIADALYGKPGEATFNTGQIGTWKLYFNDEHIQHFKEVFGAELMFLGYEEDYEW